MPVQAIYADIIVKNSHSIVKESVLLIENGQIVNCIPLKKFKLSFPLLHIEERKNSILTAGFINSHTHLELSFLGEHKKNEKFFDWVESINSKRQLISQKEQLEKNKSVLKSTIRSGTIAFGDISNSGRMIEPLIEEKIPHHTFLEVLGFEEEKSQIIWNKLLEKFNEELKYPNVSLSPHSLYSLSKELLHVLSHERSLQSIHIDELPDERQFFQNADGSIRNFLHKINAWDERWKTPQQSPYDYFSSFNFPKKSLLVHNIHIKENELLSMKDYSFVLCPRSNHFLHKQQTNYKLFEKHQIPFALGTDSLASNRDLSILNEMKFLKKHSNLSNEMIYASGTENAAKILNFTDFGSLEIGKRAVCNSFRFDVLSADPLEQLLTDSYLEHELIGL